MPEEQVHEFDEIAIVSMLLANLERLRKAKPFLLPEDFANEGCSVLLRSLYSFEAKYGRLPTVAELRDFLILPPRSPVEEIHRILAEAESKLNDNHDFYWDELKRFVQVRRAEESLLAAADDVKKRKFEEARAKLKPIFQEVEPTKVFNTVEMANVVPQSVSWLWRDVFPKNKLSLLVGDPNVGKSYFTMMLSACVSTGRPFPTTEEPVERGRVLLLAAEDGVADTICWRLVRHAADLTMIEVLTTTVGKNGNRWPDLGQDLERLKGFLAERRDIRLIVIDPISAYLGQINAFRDNAVRTVLDPLAAMAEQVGVTIVGVMHLNKSQDVGAMYRVSGSMAFVGVARAVWLVARDKDDPKLRHLAPVKCNLTAEAAGFSFTIEEGSIVLRKDEKPPDAETLLTAQPAKERAVDKAMALIQTFEAKGEVPAADVHVLAKKEGISADALDRARKIMKVASERREGYWVWVFGPRP